MTDETKATPQNGEFPAEVSLVPLREAVVFPKLVVPLGVGREKSVAAINDAMAQERHLIILAAQRDAEIDDVQPEQIYNVATIAEIVRLLRIPDGSAQIIVQGLQRVRITGYSKETRFFKVSFEPIVEDLGDAVEREAQLRSVKTLFERYVDNGGSILPELAMTAKNTDDPAHFSDLVASSPDLTLEQRQQLLETRNVIERLRFLGVFLAKQNEILELKQKIQSEVQQTLDKTQREYILREQMKAIQKELGDDDQGSEVRELREKIEQAGMPDPVKEKALKEIGRLEKIPQASPETGVIRTYVDWLVSLPWKAAANDDWDIAQAAKILDEDHYGLPKVKDRIIEYMAVRKLSQNLRAPILCFVGPPGVGKTSLGKSIARAMGCKFIRMSLGGIRDEAEIRGHRRTYVGALPGRILQNMKTAGEVNPVFMLDEIDKVGADFRGDPSSALLEVLDPEQNNTFSDHYLEVPYDLSKVIFITTANIEDTIIPPLRDRARDRARRCHAGDDRGGRRACLEPSGGRRQAGRRQAPRHHRRSAAQDHPRVHARGRRAQPRARDRRDQPQDRTQGRERRARQGDRRCGRHRDVPRAGAVRVRPCREGGHGRRRHRRLRVGARRRRPHRRGDDDGSGLEDGGVRPYRPDPEGHGGVRARGAVVR